MTGTIIIASYTAFCVLAMAILILIVMRAYRESCARDTDYADRVTKRMQAVFDRSYE
jgi:hypothetical protein